MEVLLGFQRSWGNAGLSDGKLISFLKNWFLFKSTFPKTFHLTGDPQYKHLVSSFSQLHLLMTLLKCFLWQSVFRKHHEIFTKHGLKNTVKLKYFWNSPGEEMCLVSFQNLCWVPVCTGFHKIYLSVLVCFLTNYVNLELSQCWPGQKWNSAIWNWEFGSTYCESAWKSQSLPLPLLVSFFSS